MTGLRERDTSAHGVLGDSRDSSAEEIKKGEDTLLRAAKERQPRPSTSKLLPDQAEPDAGKPPQPAPIEYAHLGELLAPTEKPQTQPANVGKRAASLASGVSSETDAAAKPVEPGSSEIVPPTNERPSSPKNFWTAKELGRFPVKAVGIVAAGAAVALSSLALFVLTPGQKPQVSTRAAPASKAVQHAISPAAKLTQLVQSAPASGEAAAMNEHAELSPSLTADSRRQFQSAPVADAARLSKPAVPPANASTAPGGLAIGSSAKGPAQAIAVAPPREPPAPIGDRGPGSSAPSVAPAVSAQAAASPLGGVIRVPAQWLSGGPINSDNHHGRYAGTVIVQFTVQPDGRASSCFTTRGSGNAELDSLTCRLVEERVRFRPALDADGRTVASPAHAIYTWGRRRR